MSKYIRLLNIFSVINNASDRVKNTISAHVFEKVYEVQIPGNVFTRVSNNKLNNLLNDYLDSGYMGNSEDLSSVIEEIEINISQKAENETFSKKIEDFSKRIEF